MTRFLLVCATIHGGGYQPKVQKFEPRHYVCSRQHLSDWMDSWVYHSSYEEGFTFWGFAIRRLRWSIGKTMCIMVHHVTFHMWMARWIHHWL
jgi:hypothetical protein